MTFLDKEFFGMKYLFPECARPELMKRIRKGMYSCVDCSVHQFCKAPEKLIDKGAK